MPDYDVDDEILQIFYEEAREHLDGIEDDLLILEEQGADVDEELINSIFRAIHTIKGGCGFFGLTKLSSLSHSMENILDRIRKKDIVATSPIVNTLLKGSDALSSMVNDPDTTDDIDIEPILANITNFLSDNLSEEEKKTQEEFIEICSKNGDIIFTVNKYEFDYAKDKDKGGNQVYLLEYDLIADIEQKGKTPWDVISELMQLTTFIDSKIAPTEVGDLTSIDNFSFKIPFYVLVSTVIETDLIYDFLDLTEKQIHIISDKGVVVYSDAVVKIAEPVVAQVAKPVVAQVAKPVVAQVAEPVEKSKPKKNKEVKKPEGNIRVGVGLLDRLMTLAGELVLARNQLNQCAESKNLTLIHDTAQRVDLITGELQEAVMATRMQSIGIVFHKFNRVVRDLSSKLGKDIELVLEGEEVELDKTIIESIGDPLTHIVRNSLDHGIETPEIRIAAGKSGQGTLKISAYHEAGHVVIAIIDDGAGVNIKKVSEKALSSGMITQEQLNAMTEKDIVELIFKPGFSTADKVTDVSGRGVGMDVVITNLTKLGGVIDVDSVEGQGTTLKIKLPLTLAIIPSLLLSVANEPFAIPQVNLVELVRLIGEELKDKIETIGDSSVLRIRGKLIPLVDAQKILNITKEKRTLSQLKAINIVIVKAGETEYGIVIDTLLDSSEIVVKPLGRHLKSCINYAGATILGDGKVALILDVMGIKTSMHLKSFSHDKFAEYADSDVKQIDDGNIDSRDKQSLVLVQNGGDEKFAIPLGIVARIEKIKSSSIEHTGGRNAIQYRGDTLPLFSLEELANITPREDKENVIVVVFKIANREVGILLNEISDVVETESKIDGITYKQPGIMGSVIVEDHITLIIDAYELVYTLMPKWKSEQNQNAVDIEHFEEEKQRVPVVLIAEDSKFFMTQITSFMEEVGYKVITAEDGALALQALQDNADVIDLVLTDIEMPNMNGLEFTKLARADGRFDNLPMIAITSVSGETAEKEGETAGLDEYLVKLDRDQILERCNYYLNKEQ